MNSLKGLMFTLSVLFNFLFATAATLLAVSNWNLEDFSNLGTGLGAIVAALALMLGYWQFRETKSSAIHSEFAKQIDVTSRSFELLKPHRKYSYTFEDHEPGGFPSDFKILFKSGLQGSTILFLIGALTEYERFSQLVDDINNRSRSLTTHHVKDLRKKVEKLANNNLQSLLVFFNNSIFYLNLHPPEAINHERITVNDRPIYLTILNLTIRFQELSEPLIELGVLEQEAFEDIPSESFKFPEGQMWSAGEWYEHNYKNLNWKYINSKH